MNIFWVNVRQTRFILTTKGLNLYIPPSLKTAFSKAVSYYYEEVAKHSGAFLPERPQERWGCPDNVQKQEEKRVRLGGVNRPAAAVAAALISSSAQTEIPAMSCVWSGAFSVIPLSIGTLETGTT